MDISNIANVPIEFSIGANKYKVSRLSLLELFAEFESEAKKGYLSDINEMATTIKDKTEKLDFMVRMMRDMPSGKRLEDLAKDRMNSMSGGLQVLYTSLKKHNKITLDEVKNLSSDESVNTQVAAIVEYALGNDLRQKEEKPEETSEKKV